MNNSETNKVTFELTDLSFEQLIETYKEVLDFLNYLNEVSIQEETEDSGEE